jgi:serine/threonine protein kinase/formylglycine-generating enzyme required for sulfatase activity
MSDDNPSTADPFGPIADEFVEAFRQGQRPSVEEFARRYPGQADAIREMLPALVLMEKARAADDSAGPVESAPSHIGRYRVEKLLGKGGFGLVYLAHDDQLQRPVAIKVPHARLVAQPTDAEAYLTEARTVANLDHPHIVPVFDVGSTEQYPCFVVSKYIDGTDLAARLKQARLAPHEAVELVATVAEALHQAHRQGLVHRDVKPGNILLDRTGKPFVGDFGLALREQDVGRGPRFAGTPAYTSPEQARGEGHRVDGRSDIFTLGVVFYELLVGRRPFRADSPAELLEQVANHEPRPLRQMDEGIPQELERICFKALAKRASERYMTARDMADDLRHFLAGQTSPGTGSIGKPSTTPAAPAPSTGAGSGIAVTPPTPTLDHPPVKIVPKGLRPFDAPDADFFLELLPGPRDREGLPDSIRFWKTRIEETEADGTFTVGLIYGPSGCGKSSLVKAGLLPRLGGDVIAVYVEATAEETEARLLNGLRKRCPALPADPGLKETLAALRRGQGIAVGKKVLIVLDQFEQWLHAKKEEANTDLVQALRQCDGGRVQCIVMVRDDFWMAATRFMRELEVRLVEGQNSAAVDLFDPDHARKVLAAFGRAFGKLPENSSEMNRGQKEFLKQAVAGLAQEGKVVSVRLALFAEMMKGKPWTPASLKAVGGTEGVGVTFLEETFSAATAPPEHRYHQKAARADLKVLLPETGSDIKGHMRSYVELLEASGYGDRPRDFDDLIRILDNEIRLITPTDPEGKEADGDSVLQTKPGEKYYQLTHDYLVHSIREWLTRKQKETRRGRAELLLADRAAVWNARPENRQLPSLAQWVQIQWLTARKNWTPPQRKMMAKAGRCHAVRGLVVAVVLALLGWGGYETHGTVQAHALRDRLLDANTADVPTIVKEMESYRRWIDPLLRDASKEAEANKDARKQLHARLALLPVDATQVGYLTHRLLDAQPHELPVIRDALAPHKDALRDRLWAVAETPDQGRESQRLRAAAALAKYDPDSERWAKASAGVVEDLVRESPIFLGQWSKAFRPVRQRLLLALSNIFGERKSDRAAERTLATNLLADYAADNPPVLADLLMHADEKQFAIIYPKFKEQADKGLPLLTAEIDRKLPADLPSSDARRETLAKRQANAAVALLRMNQPDKVWPLLKHGPDPRVRSYLIHCLSPLGADAGALLKRLAEEPDLTVRRALLLGLGEFSEKELPPATRKTLLPKLQAIYRTEADAGLHAAVEWLLRQWQQDAWLEQVNDDWARGAEQRKKRLEGIGKLLARDREKTPPQWYVNTQGQTMVVIPGPVEFQMGSPMTEKDRSGNEAQHLRRIARTFAISARSVTVGQYRQFEKGSSGRPVVSFVDLPKVNINWYQAVRYCNWLNMQEGIPEDQWCYDIKGNEIKLKEHYLTLTGYRLPTEAEMEYATRAGALTARYYGETAELLSKYSWYTKNSQERTWPGGSLKPNDLGLFDVLGNVYTWCQERYKAYPTGNEARAIEDREDELVVPIAGSRVMRGRSFMNQGTKVRSAYRNEDVPTHRSVYLGFRLARTFTP